MSLRRRNFLALLVLVSLLFTSVTPAFAQDVTPDVPDQANRIFLPSIASGSGDVVLQSPTPTGPLAPGEAPVADSTESGVKPSVAASAQGSPEQFRVASVIVVLDEGADPSAAVAAGGGQVVHRYTKVFNGVSMVLPSDNVVDVAGAQGVKAVYLDELVQLPDLRLGSFPLDHRIKHKARLKNIPVDHEPGRELPTELLPQPARQRQSPFGIQP